MSLTPDITRYLYFPRGSEPKLLEGRRRNLAGMEARLEAGAKELAGVFPEVESEIIEGLLESVEGVLTTELLRELQELAGDEELAMREASVEEGGISLDTTGKPIPLGTFIVFTSEISVYGLAVKPPTGKQLLSHYAFKADEEGPHSVSAILSPDGKSTTPSITIQVGEKNVSLAASPHVPAENGDSVSEANILDSKKGLTTETAVSMLLAAAALATKKAALGDQKMSFVERMTVELKDVFPSVEEGLIVALLESQGGLFSRTVFRQLQLEEEKCNNTSASTTNGTPTLQGNAKSAPAANAKPMPGANGKSTAQAVAGSEPKESTGTKKDSAKLKENGNGSPEKKEEKKEEKSRKKSGKKKKRKKVKEPEDPLEKGVIILGKNMKLEGHRSLSTGEVLCVVPLRTTKNLIVEVVQPSGRIRESLCRFIVLEHGIHTLRVTCDGKRSEDFRFEATSAVFEFATAIDHLYDQLFWSWEGEWHAEVETGLVNLVIAVEDNLKGFMESMKQMLKSFGQGADLEQLLTSIQENMGDAMSDHSNRAVGRLHQ
ncbi:hypothetical protein AAMO2058_001642500, partial [Amorphochlora amoebiformis]